MSKQGITRRGVVGSDVSNHKQNVYVLSEEDLKHASDSDEQPLLGDVQTSDKKKEKTSWMRIAKVIVVTIFMGFLFGLVFEKSRVFEPYHIRAQFFFTKWMMLKMFLGAMSSSAFSLGVVSLVSPTRFKKISNAFHGCNHRGVFTAVIPGAILLGVGMALGGACPGMVTAQLGSGIQNAYITLLGAMTGALVFGIMEPIMARWITSGYTIHAFTLQDLFPKFKFWMFAFPLSAFAIGGIFIIEHFFPWESELDIPNAKGCKGFGCHAWPPQVSGVLLGFLQLPAIAFIGDTLGSSTAYSALCSLTTHAMHDAHTEKYFASFASLRDSLMAWWQVPYLTMAVVGALASAYMSNSFPAKDYGVPSSTVTQSFLGGFIMLFGSRLAGGCTSGHGISGFTLSMLNSVVAMPFMFLGGITFVFIYKAIDSDFYV
eukprot:m.30651 g.30651  ORF g.30651 m.30651 type:complete len:429 (+) comp6240_c0_seq1:165-1451(+)